MQADTIYQNILRHVYESGDRIKTRNHDVYSSFNIPIVEFDTFPLVTLRKTAWKKAIREFEWFLSGDDHCPESLLSWWSGQLGQDDLYMYGYAHQLRHFGSSMVSNGYDQVEGFIDGIRHSPYSRRHIITTWNPAEMKVITEVNNNPNCPTTCHGTLVQGFVREEALYITVYQRSADLLLGMPHNWVQWWAFLLWAAYRTDLGVGAMRYILGDAHIYHNEIHLQAVQEIIDESILDVDAVLCYDSANPKVFRASDFSVIGYIPEPSTFVNPPRF